jgi:hypothetical protein
MGPACGSAPAVARPGPHTRTAGAPSGEDAHDPVAVAPEAASTLGP